MSDLELSVTGRVARLRLNRPEVLNALSPALLGDIIDACTELARQDSTVVVFEGSGSSFSAGADLPAFTDHLEAGARDHADLGRRAAEALAALPQITVAAIQGHCVGGAIVLAAACDLRVAADTSRFSIPEVDAGIPLAWGGMGRLVKLIGETLAADLVLTCRPFGAEEAQRAGFVTRIIAEDRLTDAVSGLAESIAAKPRLVLRRSKEQLIAIREGRFDAEADADALLEAFHDPEAREVGARYVASRIDKRR